MWKHVKDVSGFIVGMELEDFWGDMFTFYHIKICAYIHTDTEYKELKYSSRHTKIRDLASTQLRTASRIHVVVKVCSCRHSLFFLWQLVYLWSLERIIPGIIYAKRAILIMRFLNKNFNSFIGMIDMQSSAYD